MISRRSRYGRAGWSAGRQVRDHPRGGAAFAADLGPADEVALEATGNTWAIAALLASRAGRVVVSNPVKTRAIAEAKVKTDKVDAAILARLLAADFLPSVWLPDRRPGVASPGAAPGAYRAATDPAEKPGARDPAPQSGRALSGQRPVRDQGPRWLARQQLPPDEQATALALLRQLDFQGEELALIDADLASVALGRDDVARLMSIPGVDAIVALSIVAAVGEITRFRSPDKLVCYFGLNPRVRQSGRHAASHGRITKAGPGHARGMLVEAAWAASRTRPAARVLPTGAGAAGTQVAIVATARKLAVLCWHLLIKGESYAFAQPSLLARKHRTLELRAGPRRPTAARATPPATP